MKPRKPLKRTPLGRGKPPERKTELRRSNLTRTGFGVKSRSENATPVNGPVKARSESTHIPEPIRLAVLARDGRQCQRCGQSIEGIRYGLQHRRPRQMGGSKLLHTMANLVTLCGWTVDAGSCTEYVELRARDYATALGWLVPNGAVPGEWPVLRFGRVWMQPGESWSDADPHPRQVEMLRGAA